MRTPRLLFLVSEDWYFLSHRLPMARAALKAGYEVHVATRLGTGGPAIMAEGIHLHPLEWRRGSVNLFEFLAAIVAVRRVYRALVPDLVHQVALWPAIVGSLAAVGLPVQRLCALAGLGFAFTSNSFKARSVRAALRPILRRLLGGERSAVLVQNPDDWAMMTAVGIDPSRIFLIRGSGIDIDRFQTLPEPTGPITIAYVGRLLDDKGLRALIHAHALLVSRGQKIRLLIAGEADPANPASFPQSEIDSWRGQEGVALLGQVDDIGTVWKASHIAVLPSRREGLPLSLLEAAACGRPLVATDVPGCREIAHAGLNALLVPTDDAEALADAIERLACDAAMRARFGRESRLLVEREFSSERIGHDIVALYDRLLHRPIAADDRLAAATSKQEP